MAPRDFGATAFVLCRKRALEKKIAGLKPVPFSQRICMAGCSSGITQAVI
jgi:hypothetical protein